MTRKKTRLLLTLSAAALAAGAVRAQEANVQSAEAQLPAIVIEGATIEAPSKPKAHAKPAPEPVEFEKAKPAPAPDAADAVVPPNTSAGGSAGGFAPETDQSSGGNAGSGVPADKLGTAVSVVTSSDIQQRQIRDGGEALRSLPGISVSHSAGAGGFSQVRIRGGEGNHTLVLIDGVEANDTFNGEFYFSDLSTSDIDHIEVIRGPQSGLYGSGAIGGVVNVVTRDGRGPLTITSMGEAGSLGTYAGSLGIAGGNDKVWGAFSLYERTTGGYNISPIGGEDDGAQFKAISLRGGAMILPGVALDLTLRHSNRRGDRDDQIFDPFTFASDGLQHDTSSTFQESVWLGSAKLTWTSLDGALTQVVKAARNQTERNDHSYTDTTTSNLGLREDYSYAATYRFDTPALLAARHALTALAEHERESFTPNSDFGFGFAADGIERTRDLDAAAFEYRGEFADRLFLQGTVRHDDSSQFGGFDTWRASATVKIPEIALRPHASYGTGIKLPTMFENFGSIPGSYYANPNLGPERSKGWDVGAEVTLWPGRALVDVTYFNSELTDKIRSFADCRAAPPPFFQECTAVNETGISPRQGIEVESHLDLGYGVNVGLAYTYLDAKDSRGFQEIRRPKHSGRSDIGYAFDAGRGHLNLSAEYVADNVDTNFGDFSRVTLDPYWLVTIAASYKVMPAVELFGRVENLLDQHYQEVYGFEAAPLEAFAGVRFTYEEPQTADWVKYK
jgi:vitamin B12 transporter